MASDAEEAFRRGDISREELDVRLGRIQEEAYARRIADIRAYLSTLRDDENPDAIDIRLKLPVGDKVRSVRLHGRYRMTAAAESAIKAFDGVVSVREGERSEEPTSELQSLM